MKPIDMEHPRIVVVYHSGWGHTAQVAGHLAGALRAEQAAVTLLTTEAAASSLDILDAADTIVFGCPTYFGNVSAAFKTFMESTSAFWYRQPWAGKFAAGFTNSSTTNGDKLNTLMALSLFAAQHGMIWISQGILPRYINNRQTDGQNRMGSFLGLMTQSDNDLSAVAPVHSGDRLTIELFARRICQVTRRRLPHIPEPNEPIS